MFNQIVKLAARNVMRKSVRFSGDGGVPGAVRTLRTIRIQSYIITITLHPQNLPFPIDNKYKLTAIFIAFFGSGIGAPYLIVRHQLLKA